MGDSRSSEFERLFRQQNRALCRYIYHMVGSVDDAVEIVQETFLRLWTSEQDFDLVLSSEPGYVFKLARNIAIDTLRKKEVRGRPSTRATLSANILILPLTPEEMILERERDGLANQALGQLPDKQREMLVLRSSGFSYDEIAEITGVSRGSIGQTITRALRRCRSIYESLVGTEAEESGHASAR